MADVDLELRVAWERHVGRSPASVATYESVINRYREPHRHYHDVRHVRWVVRHVEELAAERALDDLDAVIAAAFYHDAIYDPTSPGNEDASATLASTELEALGWSTERVSPVASMITGTTDHRWERATVDAAVLYAADLGVLAASPAGYSDYVRNVRREYAHVSDPDWMIGRSAVLRSFLDRSSMYAPVLGLDDWEARARGNLAAELDGLMR